jgi:hypothetical protein
VGHLAGFSQIMKEEVFVGLRAERTGPPQEDMPHSQRNKQSAGNLGVLMRPHGAAFYRYARARQKQLLHTLNIIVLFSGLIIWQRPLVGRGYTRRSI